MKNYLDVVQEIQDTGTWQQNRTGIRCKFIPGAMLKYDLTLGFPMVTTRKIPFFSPCGEMVGFLNGFQNAREFAALGCNYWYDNANKTPSWLNSVFRKGEDDLGEIYGHFWREWASDRGFVYDQVKWAIQTLLTDPTNRRIVVNGWKVEAIMEGRGALPPCHIAWHLMANVETRELSLCWWQRSCDIALGIPSNIVEYAFLLSLIARLTGYTPKWLVGHLDDVHYYENHEEGLNLQLTRDPLPLPQLVFSDDAPQFSHMDYLKDNAAKTSLIVTALEDFRPKDDCELIGYIAHDPIKFEMAV